MIILGASNVGKTTLIHRYIHGEVTDPASVSNIDTISAKVYNKIKLLTIQPLHVWCYTFHTAI